MGTCGDELFDQLLMLGAGDIGGTCRGLPESDPGSAGELAAGSHRAAHRRRDLLERHCEHVMQDERHPLTGAQRAQHLQQGTAYLIIQRDPIGRIGNRRNIQRGSGFHHGCDPGPLTAHTRRTQLIQAQPAHHHRQPGTWLVNLRLLSPGQPHKCLLNRVLGVADIAEHLIGQVHQVRVMLAPSRGHQRVVGGRGAHVITTIP